MAYQRRPDRANLPIFTFVWLKPWHVAEELRGVLVERDELVGWIRSFDAYKNRRGADIAQWLQLHRAGPGGGRPSDVFRLYGDDGDKTTAPGLE